MKIKELLEVVEKVKGCLNKAYSSSVLSHICFTGSQIYTCNGVQAVGVPFTTKFEGALPGDQFIKVIENLDPDVDISISISKSKALIESGKSKIESAFLPKEDFIYIEPSLKEEALVKSFSLSSDIISGLKSCLISLRDKPLKSIGYGVFLYAQADRVVKLYASDDVSLSSTKIEMVDVTEGTKVFFPKYFCDQLIKNFKDEGALYHGDDFVYFSSNDFWAYSKIASDLAYLPFEEKEAEIEVSLKDKVFLLKDSYDIKSVIERSLAFCKVDSRAISISSIGGGLVFSTVGETGQIIDSLPTPEGFISNMKTSFDPQFIKRCLPMDITFTIINGTYCFVGQSKNFKYFLEQLPNSLRS